MRLIGQDDLHSTDELTTFTARSSVKAVRCDDGAAVLTGDGVTLDTYDRACYAIVDGDDVSLVPAVVFDALYTEQGGSSTPTSSASTDAPSPASVPETAPTTPISTATGPGASYAQPTTTETTASPSTGEAPTPTVPAEQSDTTTPSVADLSSTSGDGGSSSSASTQ